MAGSYQEHASAVGSWLLEPSDDPRSELHRANLFLGVPRAAKRAGHLKIGLYQGWRQVNVAQLLSARLLKV